jgi:lactate 2-monooxygenase
MVYFLVANLDTYILGWRPNDLGNGFNIEDAVSDNDHRSTMSKHGRVGLGNAAQQLASISFPGPHSWDDIKFLQENWDGPILLQGIQSVRDDKDRVQAGVQGMVVSSNGGRQLECGEASLKLLPDIVNAVGQTLDIFLR